MKELSAALAVLQEQVVDAGGEYANVKRFGQVTVRSGFVAGRMGVVRGLCREDDDGNMASGQVVLHLSAECQSVCARHLQVTHHQVYILVLEPRECQSCVVGCYDVVALSD